MAYILVMYHSSQRVPQRLYSLSDMNGMYTDDAPQQSAGSLAPEQFQSHEWHVY